jgi:hypothetical protein
MFLVPLFDLRSLNAFAATDAGTSNRRHGQKVLFFGV